MAADSLGVSLHELEPGESAFPYHTELGNDELLVVVDSRSTLRSPEGERALQPGDCVLFSTGPAGAHQSTNPSPDTARVLLMSNFALPRAAVQVDSGKIMARWGTGTDDREWFRLDDAIDYWDGEDVPPTSA